MFAGELFHVVEAAGKFGRRFLQSQFGVDVQEPSEVDGDEQEIAKFAFDALGAHRGSPSGALRRTRRQRALEFTGLLGKFGEDTVDIGPIEPDAGGFAGELKGFEERRKGAGDAVEIGFGFGVDRKRRAAGCGTGSWGTRLGGIFRDLTRGHGGSGSAFLFLDDLPVAEDVGGGFGGGGAEDVGVSPHHFVVNFADHIGDREATFFVSDLSVEQDLKKEVAEFFCEFSVVGGVERVEDFVGFLDEVGPQRGVRLFAIPRAAARGAEASHDGDKLFEIAADLRRRVAFRRALPFCLLVAGF